MPKVFIIILNWNNWGDTIECLQSVYAMDYSNFEIIVIDNASENDSLEKLRSVFPEPRLIANKINNGFTGGNNQGIKIAMEEGADYVWLLNNDTVVEFNTLSKLVDSAEQSFTVGMVSPTICYYDNPDIKQFYGSRVDWDNLKICYPSTEDVGSEYIDGIGVCLWGTALLIKRSLIERIGGLREDYFAYYEDTEYSLRSICNDFRNRLVVDAKIYHKTPLPSSGNTIRSTYYYYYIIRNKYFLWKDTNYNNKSYLTIYRQLMVDAIHRAASFKNKGLMKYSYICIEALFHALIDRRGKQPDKNSIPTWMVRILLRYPYFLLNLLVLDCHVIQQQVSNKIRESFFNKRRVE